jgi:hypothetical protein
MICPQCKEEGAKSKVHVMYIATTCVIPLKYYDEMGKFHYHDPNYTTIKYHCSNDHSWAKQKTLGKCSCGWKAGEELK